MTAAGSVMNHPTDQTLAAFVDGTLPPPERQNVIEHMADCAECRDVVLLTTEIKAAEAPAGNVVKPGFGWKKIVPLAAAASIAVILAVPQMRERFWFDPMSRAVKLAQLLEERPSDARLSLNVPYKPAKIVYRGGEDGKVGDPLTEAKADQAKALADEKPTVVNLRVAGAMLMLAGKRAEAVTYLQRAVKASNPPSAALLTDLTAAYLGNSDYPEARETAELVWRMEQTPVAAWNRALALQRLGSEDAAAKAAWETYLRMDPNSPWADEARNKHLSQLR